MMRCASCGEVINKGDSYLKRDYFEERYCENCYESNLFTWYSHPYGEEIGSENDFSEYSNGQKETI